MGWTGIPLDAFTLLVGSIAIGLAVDDTIHFMHNFRRYFDETGDVAHSIRETLRSTGQALLYTSLVLSAAFFIYMFASMDNLFYFGFLTGFTIILAFLADLILAPALLTLVARRFGLSIRIRNPRLARTKWRRPREGDNSIRSVRGAGFGVRDRGFRADEFAPVGRDIMDLVDARDDGDNAIQDMEMILIDKNGNRRDRTIRSMSRDVDEDTQSIMFFLSPADVKDTGFLTYDYDDDSKDDDQWLYLPALKKTKRIASSDKSGSFMGSDFTYADMTDRDLDNYRYTLMKEGEVGGVPVWQVEAVPLTESEIDETGYTKSVSFVRQDNYVVVRAVSWLKKGSRLKYMDVKKLEKIDGIWIPTEIHMTTKKGKKTLHKTILKATTSDSTRTSAKTSLRCASSRRGCRRKPRDVSIGQSAWRALPAALFAARYCP